MNFELGLVGNSEIVAKLSNVKGIDIIFDCPDAISALRYQQAHSADVIITEILLPGMDGFSLCENLKQMPDAPRVIIATELKSEAFLLKAIQLGINNYLVKPVCKEGLLEVLRSGSVSTNTARHKGLNKTLDEKLSNIFISVGIPAHIKGYQYLREGIKLAVDNPGIINSITKSLYPSIATHYGTTSSKVERAIRHAIEVAWNRGKIENINSLFGVKVYGSNEKPTNGEFIALLADKMLLECVY